MTLLAVDPFCANFQDCRRRDRAAREAGHETWGHIRPKDVGRSSNQTRLVSASCVSLDWRPVSHFSPVGVSLAVSAVFTISVGEALCSVTTLFEKNFFEMLELLEFGDTLMMLFSKVCL